jgi:hypothetical protein
VKKSQLQNRINELYEEARITQLDRNSATDELYLCSKCNEGEKEAVFICHDESTFYCCEGQRMMWMEDRKSKILPKTKGTSIMVI